MGNQLKRSIYPTATVFFRNALRVIFLFDDMSFTSCFNQLKLVHFPPPIYPMLILSISFSLLNHLLSVFFFKAIQTFSEVRGRSVTQTPAASWTAAETASGVPMVAISPTPFAPNGPMGPIDSTVIDSMGGM